jgi:hypothetical protein
MLIPLSKTNNSGRVSISAYCRVEHRTRNLLKQQAQNKTAELKLQTREGGFKGKVQPDETRTTRECTNFRHQDWFSVSVLDTV